MTRGRLAIFPHATFVQAHVTNRRARLNCHTASALSWLKATMNGTVDSLLTIRPARRGDEQALLTLVRGLNEHQRDPVGRFNAEALERDVFADGATLRALVAERDGVLLGYAFFHQAYESAHAARGIYLCDLYVAPHAQGAGVGRALVAAVAAEAKAAGRTFLWWVVKDWNEAARRFYKALGAISDPVGAHALTFDAFEALAAEGKAWAA